MAVPAWQSYLIGHPDVILEGVGFNDGAQLDMMKTDEVCYIVFDKEERVHDVDDLNRCAQICGCDCRLPRTSLLKSPLCRAWPLEAVCTSKLVPVVVFYYS